MLILKDELMILSTFLLPGYGLSGGRNSAIWYDLKIYFDIILRYMFNYVLSVDGVTHRSDTRVLLHLSLFFK